MHAVSDLAAAMADSGKFDIRLEAAIAKMWNSEAAWRHVDETLQIRGGRGYETAASVAGRGEEAIPVERMMRDLRINLIFEGSSEIMRLFIAREAVDPHLKAAGALADPRSSLGDKVIGALKGALHFATWYPSLLIPRPAEMRGMPRKLRRHLQEAERLSRKVGRATAHAMVRFGPGLEKKQAVLGRIVEAGADIFAVTAACHRAALLQKDPAQKKSAIQLADIFSRNALARVRRTLDRVFDPADAANHRLAIDVLDGKHTWLE